MIGPIDSEVLQGIAGIPQSELDDLDRARAEGAAWEDTLDGPNLERVDERLTSVETADGSVPVRIYTPRTESGGRPGILHIHGGGFVAGSAHLTSTRTVCVALAEQLDAVVVSVDYRLAPEHPYPAGVNDCFGVLQWLAANTGTLGIHGKLAIHGISAGGGLAAAVALMDRDRGLRALDFQFLGVPELDDRLVTGSMREMTDTPIWSRSKAIVSWRSYLGEYFGSDDVPIHAAPARAVDLRGLPPAYVSVNAIDPLRDEGIAYAALLLASGVDTELHVFNGTVHGTGQIVPDSRIGRLEREEEIRVLRTALA